ncbi:hypothetical protein R5M92_00635 [Halomonas sp. Bachu 37]|uniref:hypothetical protein n=1 Tax=Halomonas kashgarensis TaxID=3084920 RepID=UPI0032166BB6
MSESDQAAGLRKWANLQRQQQGVVDAHDEQNMADDRAASVELPVEAPATPSSEPPPAHTSVRQAPRLPLVVVGLAQASPAQVAKVRARLGQWSAEGRRWAGAPEDWQIQLVPPGATNLTGLVREQSRWALWVDSDAEAFMRGFRALHAMHQAGGPSRLLALHEPGLPRRGLLDNLQVAANYYLGIELLVLAR